MKLAMDDKRFSTILRMIIISTAFAVFSVLFMPTIFAKILFSLAFPIFFSTFYFRHIAKQDSKASPKRQSTRSSSSVYFYTLWVFTSLSNFGLLFWNPKGFENIHFVFTKIGIILFTWTIPFWGQHLADGRPMTEKERRFVIAYGSLSIVIILVSISLWWLQSKA